MSEKEKNQWKEFRESGLLWWINMILHTFGWALEITFDDKGEIIRGYPKKVNYRGFGAKQNSIGYSKVSNYLQENIGEIMSAFEER